MDPLQGDARSPSPLRLAQLLGALSLATDLANGQPAEYGLRTAILATRLVRGEPLATRKDVFWTGVLRFVGCNGFAVEEAGFAAGDDIGLRESFIRTDLGRPSEFAGAVLRDVGRGAPWWPRLRGVTRLLTSPGAPRAHALAQCDAGVHCGRKLAMPENVVQALADSDERFDGRGQPAGKSGHALNLASRCVEVARVATLFHRLGGVAAARVELKRRAGGHLDPELVHRFDADAQTLCEGLGEASVWDEFLAHEPGLWLLDAGALRPVLEAFALVVDLKSGYLAGHSSGVAALALAAGQSMGLPSDALTQLEGAGLLHDVGRLVVPTGLWDKPGPLNAAEWERVQSHSYYTERLLRYSPALAPYAEVAGRCHERLDGSGYHRGEGAALTRSARLLAAADAYRACTEPRAHRAAMTPEAARAVVLHEVQAKRLCADAVNAVLKAAGQKAAPRSHDSPLSERELQVLRLLVRGLSNKHIARELGVSPRTVQQHTIHIYAKTGVQSRAGAALWAVDHGLFS
jgi:HD-GYP domain-containing protein (c-di-GMP phosphodiesterase class II)